jgi:hypothetical protein
MVKTQLQTSSVSVTGSNSIIYRLIAQSNSPIIADGAGSQTTQLVGAKKGRITRRHQAKSPQKLDLDRRTAEDKESRNASAWLWDIQFASHSSLAGPCVVA